MKRKLLSILTAASLLLPFMPDHAFAAAENKYFYNQLSADAKNAYDYISSNLGTLKQNSTLHMSKQVSSLDSYCKAVTEAAMAFMADRPDVFWTGNRVAVSGYGYGNQYTFDISFEFGNSWASGTRSIAYDESYVNKMTDSIAATAKNQGDTIYEQLLWAHDWLIDNNLYNSEAANIPNAENAYDSTPWEAISALDKSLSPVCEGYSRAFKLICDKLGVPCVLVSGSNHMWNNVQMDDGKWYAVDVTFDDPVGGPRQLKSGYENHENFLVGSLSFTGHAVDSEWLYPALSPEDYDPDNAKPVLAHPAAQTIQGSLFKDVPDNAWYFSNLSDLVKQKIIGGYSDGSFKPNGNVKYGEALKMIMLAAGYEAEDPTGTHWASGYQEAAIAIGILDKAVDLNKDINRYDVAKLASRALGFPEVPPVYSPFSDMDKNDPEAPYVMNLYNEAIFTGSNSESGLVFNGANTIKRSEISAVIWRIYNYMV